MLTVPEHFKGPLHFLHHGFLGLLKPLRPFLVEGTFSVKFTLEQAMKAHRGSIGIALLFL
jgi:hypothetical protein